MLPWPLALRLALIIAVGVSAGQAIRAIMSGTAQALCLLDSKRLELISAAGKRIAVSVLPDSTVFDCLIVLRYREAEEGAAKSLVLLPDQMTSEAFRQLRLWLRWHGEAKKGAGLGG